MKALAIASLCLSPLPALAQDYRLPLELGGSLGAPYVTAYRDHDGGSGLQDWSCGRQTYNGHRGTDIGIGGFPAMDAGSRWVVAAAEGVVATAVDGCFDRCTTGGCDCGAGFGNYVKVTHPDGKSTFYGHLMRGTVQVQPGDQVSCGARLGRVGSSGNSTGPHLHFEPRYASNVSDDPFAGSCSGPTSFWVSQGAYDDLPATTCEGGAPPPPPPPQEGELKGVVWDLAVTAGPSDPGSRRIAGAQVEILGGAAAVARAEDAFWSFRLAPGSYTVAAEAPGYRRAERQVVVAAGQETWASLGLEPTAPPPPPPPPPEAGQPVAVEIVGPDREVALERAPPAVAPAVPAEPVEESGGCACAAPRRGTGDAARIALLLAVIVSGSRRSWPARRRSSRPG
jgi:murein DD-endopeptidase MepM/ murein hydrolase activator NlpD